METSPLEKIKNWLLQQSNTVREDIIMIAGHLHPNKKVFNSTGSEKVTYFMKYLDYPVKSNVDKRHVISRTLIVSRLIDHMLSNRDSEADWTDSLNRILDMKSLAMEEGNDDDLTGLLLNNFTEKKELWLSVSSDWYNLKETELTDKQIADWYFFS